MFGFFPFGNVSWMLESFIYLIYLKRWDTQFLNRLSQMSKFDFLWFHLLHFTVQKQQQHAGDSIQIFNYVKI